VRSPVIVVVMGVSGSGKTTISALLAAALGCQFQEGDDLHSAENVEKMQGGTPLTDADRLPWLHRIAAEIDGWRAEGLSGVLTCSALKRSYRDIIIGERPGVTLVYLKGTHDLIRRRMAARHEHFMPDALLDSQFAALEEPTSDEHPIIVDDNGPASAIVAEIVHQLELVHGTSVAPDPQLEILADPEVLSVRVADWLLDAVMAAEGVVAIALSGGSTPRRLYERLAGSPYRDRFPWRRTHWFWGDERFVPHDDARSNQRMAREALLSLVPIPIANIHPILTEGLSPDRAAAAYEQTLKAFYGAETLDPARPLFDVTFLGLGTDGHVASLFPETDVLAMRDRWVAAVAVGEGERRITLTYPAVESSRRVAVLVAGAEKRAILGRLLHGDDSLPAVHLHPNGRLWIFGDAAAGKGLA
jgi:6-phosphogluconolactonase